MHAEADELDPPLWRSWYALFVMIGVIGFASFNQQVLRLMAAPIIHSLKLSYTQLGMTEGLGAAVFTTLAIYPLGWLGDRVSRRFTLLLCIAIWGAGTAACGFALSYHQFFLAVVAIAAAESGLGPVMISVVPDLFPDRRRATANAFYVGGLRLTGAATLFLFGAAAAGVEAVRGGLPIWLRDFESWRLMFFLAAAPTPVFLVLVAMTKFDRGYQARPRSAPAATARLWPYLRANGGTVALVLGAMIICSIGSSTGHAWVAVALARLYHVSPATNGLGLGVASAVAALASIALTGWLTRMLRRRVGHRAPLRLIGLGMMTLIVPATLMVFIAAPWQGFGLETVQLVISAIFVTLSFYVFQDIAPSELRGQLVALNAIVSQPIGGAGAVLVGLISDRLANNPRNVLIASAVVSVALLVLGCALLGLAEGPYVRLRNKFAGATADDKPLAPAAPDLAWTTASITPEPGETHV